MKYWIETRHLKGIYLSFRNIIKFLTLDQLLKDPHPFRLIRESFLRCTPPLHVGLCFVVCAICAVLPPCMCDCVL